MRRLIKGHLRGRFQKYFVLLEESHPNLSRPLATYHPSMCDLGPPYGMMLVETD